jgi:hypothetical protein
MIAPETRFDNCKNIYNVVCMDTCVILVSSTKFILYNFFYQIPHLSWKDQNYDNSDLLLAMIFSFDIVVTVYVDLSCELSNPN